MAVIFYLTGTGNSLYGAKKLAAALPEPCRLETIASYLNNPYQVQDKLVGIVCPVYCFSLPPLVEKFIESLQARPHYCFGLVTMGANPGRALLTMQELLLAKGIELAYGAAVAMPDNFYPMPEKAAGLLKAAERELEAHAAALAAGKKDLTCCKEAFFWKHFGIAACWWVMKHFVGVEKLQAGSSCIGCGRCAAICPTGNITMVAGRPTFAAGCATCYGCINHCPAQAITIGRCTGKKQYINPYIALEEYGR